MESDPELGTPDGDIANTALPTIARDLQASDAGSIWIVSGYQLAMVAGLLPAAALGEILGHRRVYIVGLAIFILSSLASGLAPSLPTLVIARVLQGLGAAGVMSVNGALLRFIYPSHLLGRGLGLNAMVVGISFAAGPTVASAILLLGSWHWLFLINVPIGLLSFALALAVLLPLAWPLRESPGREQGASAGEAGLSMSAAIREAFAQPGFWLLNLGFLACGFQLAFIGTHLPAYLMDKGLRASDAVAALAIIALTNVMGTYVCGVLGGRHRRKYLLAGIYLLRTAAIALFVLLPLSSWTVYVFAAVMGFVWLGTVPLTNGLISQVFGVRYITTLFGFVFFGHQLGAFLGVWLGGVVFEATGSYDLIWLGAMALGVLSAALHWPIDDREIPRVRTAGAPG
ncbi:MFS transporter [Achromobacter xylosoxidans]|nr:MFS transporter [Achromobacter xylosoxidans]